MRKCRMERTGEEELGERGDDALENDLVEGRDVA